MSNTIPPFSSNGILPTGIHTCSGSEFIERFCREKGVRQDLRKAFIDVLDFAASRNARFVFVGGSFVTEKEAPDDIDIVIAFRDKLHIPSKSERLVLAGARTDIMFCSEDEPKILDAFLHLLSNGRYGESPGVIQVNLLHQGAAWQVHHLPDEDTYEVIKRVYFNRQLIDLNTPSGVLVTVHGLMSHADWNSHIVPIASSQGWTIAPYIYGYQNVDILFNASKRRAAVDAFRHWLFELQYQYCSTGTQISVVAHSFGTYLVGAYLDGFEKTTPVPFNSVILTGSILNEKFDWGGCAGGKVARIRNEIAPNDQWVKWMPDTPSAWVGLDPLFGKAGTQGFSDTTEILVQHSNKIFDHNNVIEKDFITSQWMPYLNSNRYAHYDAFFKFSLNKFAKPSENTDS